MRSWDTFYSRILRLDGFASDKGYRFYVDHLMEEKNREVDDMKQFVIEHTEKMEQVLQKVAKFWQPIPTMQQWYQRRVIIGTK